MEYIKGDDLASLLRREGPWDLRARGALLHAGLLGADRGARGGDRSPRSQAGKPDGRSPPRRRRAREGARLRPREAARARRAERAHQLGRAGDRHAVLHGARAGARRGSRRARRYLQPGRDAVPRADRRAAVRRAVADERALEAPHRRRRAAAQPRARRASLPPDADRIVLRAMAKSVEDRYASAAEVQQDLERALDGAGRRSRRSVADGARCAARQAVARATGEAPTLPLGCGRARARPR